MVKNNMLSQTGHQVRLLDTPVAEFLAKRNAGEEGGAGAQAPPRPQTPFDIATIQVRFWEGERRSRLCVGRRRRISFPRGSQTTTNPALGQDGKCQRNTCAQAPLPRSAKRHPQVRGRVSCWLSGRAPRTLPPHSDISTQGTGRLLTTANVSLSLKRIYFLCCAR